MTQEMDYVPNYDSTSQVAKILAEGKANRWNIRWSGPGGKTMTNYDKFTPDITASLKSLFGENYKNEGVWGLSDYVKWLFATGDILDTRAQFLDRRQKIFRNYGMAHQEPIARATLQYVNRIGNGYGTLKGQPYDFNAYLEFHRDKSILLEVEFPIGDGAELISLYLFKGCEHKFNHVSGGRCYTVSTCEKCGYRYEIDSSD